MARAKLVQRRKQQEEAERRALVEAQRARQEADRANEDDLIAFFKAQAQKATAKQRYEDDLRAADAGMAQPLQRVVQRVGSVSEAAKLLDISASSARALLRRTARDSDDAPQDTPTVDADASPGEQGSAPAEVA